MKKYFVSSLFFILGVVPVFAVFSVFGASGCTQKTAQVKSISPNETEGLLRNDFAVLVDVRELDEVKEGMAAPAQWMPLSKIQANDPEWQQFLEKLPKDKQIVVYCRSGRRSGIVAEMLAAKGLKVYNMGGFQSWKDAGLPVKKYEAAK